MFFSANREEAAHRLEEARRGTGDMDTIGVMIAMAQFDACAKAKKEKSTSVKNDGSNDIIESNQE
jgi:hypothetical protein